MNKTMHLSLQFFEFSLDFEVWLELSKEWTNRFAFYGPDFIFAIVETWMRVENSRYLIIPENNPGNFIETLKYLTTTFRNPTTVLGIEKIIAQGGLYAWMSSYWNRLKDDCSISCDEEIYNLLISAQVLDAHEGSIAIYRYNGAATIEVVARTNSGNAISAWCEFDTELAALEAERLRQLIATVLSQS